jgi:uncharacterized protein YndB with AHSA1/START domain
MDNFDWTSFKLQIAIKKTEEELFNAWAVPSEIEKWFLKTAEYTGQQNANREKNLSTETGDRYNWTWYLYSETEHGRILNVAPAKSFSFTFAGDCIVNVTFRPDGEYTIVQLTQSEIPTDERSKKEIRLGCEKGWSFFLVNLKSFYENGIDLRNKDERLKGMVNS